MFISYRKLILRLERANKRLKLHKEPNMGSSWSVYVGRGEVLSLGLLPARCRWVRGACMTLLRLQAEQWCTQCTWAGRWRDKTALGNDGVSSTPSSSLGKRCAMLREEWVACFNAKTRQVGARNNQRCLCLFETQVYSSLFLFCTGLVTVTLELSTKK